MRLRGTRTSRPSTVMGTRSGAVAFHCERRARVLLRDILRFGTAMSVSAGIWAFRDAHAVLVPDLRRSSGNRQQADVSSQDRSPARPLANRPADLGSGA